MEYRNLLPLLKKILINHGIGICISRNPNITMDIIKANPDTTMGVVVYI